MRRYVRKGEKGIVILAPMIGRKKSADDELAASEGSRLYGFQAAHVYAFLIVNEQNVAPRIMVKADITDRYCLRAALWPCSRASIRRVRALSLSVLA
jgi:hypothetical protein